MLWLGKLYILFFKKDDTAEDLVHLRYVILSTNSKSKNRDARLTCK